MEKKSEAAKGADDREKPPERMLRISDRCGGWGGVLRKWDGRLCLLLWSIVLLTYVCYFVMRRKIGRDGFNVTIEIHGSWIFSTAGRFFETHGSLPGGK